MKITLYDMIGTCIILKCSSGITYTNQTGGTACLQPEYQGALIPIGNDVGLPKNNLISPENELIEYFKGVPWNGTGATLGLTKNDVIAIEAILNKYDLSKVISIDTAKLTDSHEAWIHVKVTEIANKTLFYGFGPYPCQGVLTWSNSD